MLSLFFENCRVKKKCFHSFSRSAKWNQNASRLRSRSEISREFLTILEKRDFWTDLFRESQIRLLTQMACSRGNNHEHVHNLTILKSESSLINLLYCRPINLLISTLDRSIYCCKRLLKFYLILFASTFATRPCFLMWCYIFAFCNKIFKWPLQKDHNNSL